MTAGALEALGPTVREGLVITKYGHGDPELCRTTRLICLEAGHPVPDQNSLTAGSSLVHFVERAVRGEGLFLLSGGASSLVEVLPERLTLEDLRRATRWLLASGLPIGEVNRVRAALSCIKGGRLVWHVRHGAGRVLLISDVPGDDLAVVGSGLLAPAQPGQLPPLPDWLAGLCAGASAPPGIQAFSYIDTQLVASLGHAKAAAAEYGAALGYGVRRHTTLVTGDAVQAGRSLARTLLGGAEGMHIWGGETTVRLPKQPGRGGRNQTLALAAALELQGHPGVWLMAIGTDGTDGPTEDAGAVVDGETVQRGMRAGLDPVTCLANADAGTFLSASGDLLRTGPTGTNVMDLMIGLKANR